MLPAKPDYGGEANIEVYSTRVADETIAIVFMHATLPGGAAAARDQRFILEHIQFP